MATNIRTIGWFSLTMMVVLLGGCKPKQNPTEELFKAIRSGNEATVRSLLGAGVSPDAMEGQFRTALMMSIEEQHADISRLLIERGASVTAKQGMDCTALHFAAIYPKMYQIAKLLVAGGADVNAHMSTIHGGGGNTPLWFAATVGNDQCAVLLLGAGADPLAVDGQGKTALHNAAGGTPTGGLEVTHHPVKEGHLRVAKLLLEKGVDVNATDVSGKTPLNYAKEAAAESTATGGAKQMVELLIAHGAHEGTIRPQSSPSGEFPASSPWESSFGGHAPPPPSGK